MRTRILIAWALALAAFPAVAPAAGPGTVALTECNRALEADQRSATFEGRMRRVAGAQRLQMRFTLLQRAGGRWSAVDAEGWDGWVTSDAGVAEYHYAREVAGLFAPAAYRTVVKFRWLDASGEVVARRKARSQRCRQPDLRPNLRVVDVRWRDGRYLAVVRNAGRSRAGASTLDLAIDGAEPISAAVRPIRPRSRRIVRIDGPRCTPGGPGLSALADTRDAVAERDETDNAFARNCPPAAR